MQRWLVLAALVWFTACSDDGAGICGEAIPGGWTGYVELFEGAPSNAPSTCSAGFTSLTLAGSADVIPSMAGTCPTCGTMPLSSCPVGPPPPTPGTFPPLAWMTAAWTCEATSAARSAGSATCATAAPFRAGICIHQNGDLPCPAGAFTEKHVYYLGVHDTRSMNCRCYLHAGACTNIDGIFSGSVVPVDPVTYCCVP